MQGTGGRVCATLGVETGHPTTVYLVSAGEK